METRKQGGKGVVLGLLVLVFSILLLSGGIVFATGGDLGGPSQNGSADLPYLIEDFNDFEVFRSDPDYWASGVNTRLDCDLDLDPNLAGRMIYNQALIAGDTDTDSTFDGTKYAGNFNGNGHFISNLTIDGVSYCGLFGQTDGGSSITDLSLENASIIGSGYYVAAMVAYNYGSIISSYSTGEVTGSGDSVGGLVGGNGGSITSSYSTGAVNGDDRVGGLVGENSVMDGGIISSSYSTGAVTGSGDYVGGLVGSNHSIITNSYSTGAVNGDRCVGGLVGYNSGSITSSYSTGVATGSGYGVGGLVGFNYYGIITSSYSTGAVTGDDSVGGLVGWNEGSITSSFWDTQTSAMAIGVGGGITTGATGKTTLEMQTESTFTDAGWDFVGETANGTSQTWQMPVGGGYPVPSVFNGYVPVVLSGNGSKENPYLIGDANDLGAVIYYDNSGCYKLIADINLADIQWQSAIVSSFAGHFDGDGYIISNMNINGGGYLGLFGILYNWAEVANIGLENVMVTGTGRYVAALVGLNSGSITSSYSTGAVTGSGEYVGGLVGLNGGIITSSYWTGVVTGDRNVGGLVGSNSGIITSSYSTGAVTGDYRVGGLVGENSARDGGIITSSYSTGAVTGDDYVGGLVGGNSGIINSSYSSGAVNGNSDVGGLVGGNGGIITSSFWDTQTSAMTIGVGGGITTGATGKTTLEMQTESTFTDAGWDFVGETANGTSQTWQMPVGGGYPVPSVFNGYVPVVLSGNGSKENPYLIGDANDLGAVIYYDNSGCYKLIADINLADIQWQSAIMPGFTGHFDGDGYIISNMNINGGGYLGLFGILYNGAEVANIGLESVMVTGTGGSVAGLVGSNDGIITSSYSTGEVNGNSGVGGLVGGNSGIITSSHSTGAINGYGYEVGGLVGSNYGGIITSSYSTVAVTGYNDYVGGLVGYNDHGIITSSYSTGVVTGYNYEGNTTSSYSTGAVAIYNDYVGGLVGWNRGNITSSYSTGAVNGYNGVGGLVGYNYYGSSITSSYSTGQVTGSGHDVGGLVGYNYYGSISITRSFWDTQTSTMDIGVGYGTTPGVVGKTTLEMQTQSTFTGAGWDFVGEIANGNEDVWRMCVDGVSYPKLWWEFATGDFVCGDAVDFVDFALLADTWNLSTGQTGYNYKCDLSGDEVIDFADLAIFCDNWLEGI